MSPQGTSCCHTPKAAIPQHCRHQLCWKQAVKHKLILILLACFLWFTPAFFSFHPGTLCSVCRSLLFTAIASIQTPMPIACCQETVFSAWSKDTSQRGESRASISESLLQQQVERGERSRVSWEFPFCMTIFPLSIQVSRFSLPGQLVKEHTEFQAKHTADPEALSRITSWKAKTRKWIISE